MTQSTRPSRIPLRSIPPRRRGSSSSQLKSIGGDFSVRDKTGLLIERLSEEAGWDFFLKQSEGNMVELLRQGIVVAKQNCIPDPRGSQGAIPL